MSTGPFESIYFVYGNVTQVWNLASAETTSVPFLTLRRGITCVCRTCTSKRLSFVLCFCLLSNLKLIIEAQEQIACNNLDVQCLINGLAISFKLLIDALALPPNPRPNIF